MVAVVLLLEVSVESSQNTQQLYARLEFVYKHSVVHKYAEWTRVRFFGWAFEKFEDDMDLKESQEPPGESSSPMSLMAVFGIAVRFVLSSVILINTCRFGFLFL